MALPRRRTDPSVHRGHPLIFTPTDEERLVLDLFLGVGRTRDSRAKEDGKTFTATELFYMPPDEFDRLHHFIQCMYPTDNSTPHHDQPFILTRNVANFLYRNATTKAWIAAFADKFFASIYVDLETLDSTGALGEITPVLKLAHQDPAAKHHVRILQGHSKQRLTRVITFMGLMGMYGYLDVIKVYLRSLDSEHSIRGSSQMWANALDHTESLIDLG